jgi:hypothetical protein
VTPQAHDAYQVIDDGQPNADHDPLEEAGDRGERGGRHFLERACQEEQDRHHEHGRGHARDLRPPAHHLDHGGPGRARARRDPARDARCEVGRAQTDEITVGVDRLLG